VDIKNLTITSRIAIKSYFSIIIAGSNGHVHFYF